MTVSVALLRPLASVLDRLEPACGDRFLDALNIDADTDADTYLDGARVDRLLDELAARRRDRAFALTLAQTSLAYPLGLLGHVIWLSGTLRDALARAVKFYGVVSRRTTVELDVRGATAIVRQRGARGAILTEYPFASLALRARTATGGRFAPRAVRFAHAGTALPIYREVFGVRVAFDAGVDELELDAAMLELPLAASDPITSAALEARAAQLVATPATGFVERVRRAVDVADPAPGRVAKRLGISTRTLRRRLEQEGRSLRAIVDGVRRERADELLAAGIAIKDIAFRLGFSEPSAFSRAYKRWTGGTPVNRLARSGHGRAPASDD